MRFLGHGILLLAAGFEGVLIYGVLTNFCGVRGTRAHSAVVSTDAVTIRRSRDANGWLGNMAGGYPVVFAGAVWSTAEALFQALRLSDPGDREQVRAAPNGYAAKVVARALVDGGAGLAVAPRSAGDLDNMRLCVQLKLGQHRSVRDRLAATGDRLIVEDVSRRPADGTHDFWGARLVGGVWVGQNWLGRIWMEARGS